MVFSLILFRDQLNLVPDHVTFSFSDSISHLWNGDDIPFFSVSICLVYLAYRVFETYSISHHY